MLLPRPRDNHVPLRLQGAGSCAALEMKLSRLYYNMPANLENSAVAIGLEKVSFHSNPKERQCQRMLKLLYNCTHLTCQKSNAQNSPSQASKVCEPSTSRCSSGFQKRQRNQRSKLPTSIGSQKKQENSRKNICFTDYAKDFNCVDHNKLWKILKEMVIPDHLTCLLRNLCAGQEASQNWAWNSRLVPNWERSATRLYTVTLFI